MFLIAVLLIAFGVAGFFVPEQIFAKPNAYQPLICLFFVGAGAWLLYRFYQKQSLSKHD